VYVVPEPLFLCIGGFPWFLVILVVLRGIVCLCPPLFQKIFCLILLARAWRWPGNAQKRRFFTCTLVSWPGLGCLNMPKSRFFVVFQGFYAISPVFHVFLVCF